MHSYRIYWILLFVFLSPNVWAERANCTIEIEDINAQVQNRSSDKIILQYGFELSPEAEAQRRYFDLSGGQHICTLAFFSLHIGTSLSCERKTDGGYTYVQSDRSGFREHSSSNNLIFKDKTSHFVLNAKCN